MKTLFKAISAFQQEVPAIHKGTQGYGYSYADLPAILEIINPIMQKHKLGFTQLGENGGIKTIIFHEDGESIESFFEIPTGVELKGMNHFQVLGSAITYIRRYALASALGIVTDIDNDGNGQKPKAESKTEPPLGAGNAPDDKPWFNPTNKSGEVTKAGQGWLDYMAQHGKEKALKMALNKYKASKAVREWMEAQ